MTLLTSTCVQFNVSALFCRRAFIYAHVTIHLICHLYRPALLPCVAGMLCGHEMYTSVETLPTSTNLLDLKSIIIHHVLQACFVATRCTQAWRLFQHLKTCSILEASSSSILCCRHAVGPRDLWRDSRHHDSGQAPCRRPAHRGGAHEAARGGCNESRWEGGCLPIVRSAIAGGKQHVAVAMKPGGKGPACEAFQQVIGSYIEGWPEPYNTFSNIVYTVCR